MKIFGKKITWRFRQANSYRMATDYKGNRYKVTSFPWFETYKTTEPKTGRHGKAFNAGRLYVHIGRPQSIEVCTMQQYGAYLCRLQIGTKACCAIAYGVLMLGKMNQAEYLQIYLIQKKKQNEKCN